MKIERGNDPGPFSKPSAYKPHLRPVFRCRCAYCLTRDERLGGEEAMTVDHFKPESRYPNLRLAWSNLYYACAVCNSHWKKDHPWPDEEAEGKRFVDSCDEDPDEHFRMVRDANTGDFCNVQPRSDAASYTVECLGFNRRKFLRDFWRNIDHDERRLKSRITEIREYCVECDELARKLSSVLQVTPIRARLESMLQELEGSLRHVTAQRPFPLEEEPEKQEIR